MAEIVSLSRLGRGCFAMPASTHAPRRFINVWCPRAPSGMECSVGVARHIARHREGHSKVAEERKEGVRCHSAKIRTAVDSPHGYTVTLNWPGWVWDNEVAVQLNTSPGRMGSSPPRRDRKG